MQRDYGRGLPYGMDSNNERYGPYESYDSRSSLGGRDLMRSGYGYNESEQGRFTDSFDEGYDNFGGRNQGGSSWDAPYSRPNMRTGFMNDRGRGSYSSFSGFSSSLMKPAPAGLRGRGMPAYPEGAFGGRGYGGPSTGRGRGRGQNAYRGNSVQGANMQSRGGATGRGTKRKMNQPADKPAESAGKKAKVAKQAGAANAVNTSGNKKVEDTAEEMAEKGVLNGGENRKENSKARKKRSSKKRKRSRQIYGTNGTPEGEQEQEVRVENPNTKIRLQELMEEENGYAPTPTETEERAEDGDKDNLKTSKKRKRNRRKKGPKEGEPSEEDGMQAAVKPEVNDEEEEKRKIEARREKQRRRREKNNEKMAYTCSFCKYRSFEEKDIEAHLESALHKETLDHIQKQTKFEDKVMEFLHECMVNKYKKTSLRKAQNLEAATLAQRNMMEGITDEDHMIKVETVHCSACNVYVPALYSSVQQHFKSPEHAKSKAAFQEQVKRESVLTATSILNNPVVKARYERFAKGENPFEVEQTSEQVADENEAQDANEQGEQGEQADFAEDAAIDFTEDSANFVDDAANAPDDSGTAELAEDTAEFAEDAEDTSDQIDFTADYVTSEEN